MNGVPTEAHNQLTPTAYVAKMARSISSCLNDKYFKVVIGEE